MTVAGSMNAQHHVVLIVDRSYGKKLRKVTSALPIWIVATTNNMPEVREQWSLRPNRTHLHRITSFNDEPALSTEELAESMIETIEEHHGAYSHDPPMDVLDIIGSPKTTQLIRKLESVGFVMAGEENGHLRFTRMQP